jgi:hypothetical protein
LGDLATAQNYFLMGLEYGSGLAALLLGLSLKTGVTT